jgi:NAD(P) transhydrogenase
MKQYDLVVIGSGPAGEKAALHAAWHGYNVAVVEKSTHLGGAGVNTGTLPSKTLKETALYLSGALDKGLYSLDHKLAHAPGAADFLFRERFVVNTESEEVRMDLLAQHVHVYRGLGSFVDAHTVQVDGREVLYGHYILIATGSYPAHPPGIVFDARRIHDSDTILQIDHIPSTLCIVGAGVIGCEYATIFATMGTRVTLINAHHEILPFLDTELSAALLQHMSNIGIRIESGARVETVSTLPRNGSSTVVTRCTDGLDLQTDMFLYTAGRNGNTTQLRCENAGLQPTPRETLEVDHEFRTAVPHIFAVGDVIGFPALGSTSMDQGRVAVTHILACTTSNVSRSFFRSASTLSRRSPWLA